MQTAENKRRPGRPPSNKTKLHLNREGVVSQPSNAGASKQKVNVVEIVYDNPMMFKKMIGLFKAYNASQIDILFDKTTMYMYALDHYNSVYIFIEIFGEKMNRYYVTKPLKISLDTKRFCNVFQGINKAYDQLIFVTNENNKHAKLWTIFKKANHDSRYGIELSPHNDSDQMKNIKAIVRDSKLYPISFELPFKELKNKISELLHITKKINIGQEMFEGTPRIVFTCSSKDGQIENKSIYTDPNKIDLVSNFNGPYFTAPIWINYIRPFANSLIGDIIKLRIDEQKDIVLLANLDFDEKDKTPIRGTEKCRVTLTAKLAFSEENPSAHSSTY